MPRPGSGRCATPLPGPTTCCRLSNRRCSAAWRSSPAASPWRGPREGDLAAGAGDGMFYRHPTMPARSPTVLEDLAALVDHSLVQRVTGLAEQEPRYRMLETVREFGRVRLAESGEEEVVRHRHLRYLVVMAEQLSEQILLPE